MESMTARLGRVRAAAHQARARVDDVSVTATSRPPLVRVTASGRGEVTDVALLGERYRTMAPAEFAAILLDTVRDAQTQARGQVEAALDEAFPHRAGPATAVDPAGTLTGMGARMAASGLDPDLVREVRVATGLDR